MEDNDYMVKSPIHKHKIKLETSLKGFFAITWQSLLINAIFVMLSFVVSYDLISKVNSRLAGETILVGLTADSTFIVKDEANNFVPNTSTFKYPEEGPAITKNTADSLKLKLKIKFNEGVYPEIELKGKINKKELVALLKANHSWSVENQEAFRVLYMKSHPFGEADVKHHWIFSFINPFFFILFLFIAFHGYIKMTKAFNEGNMPDTEALEEMEQSYLNFIDVLGFSVPLLGAAILLLSVIVGPVMFINFSIPFEIKAILVLILSKTFTLVIDAIADTFRLVHYKMETGGTEDIVQETNSKGVLTQTDSKLISEGFEVFTKEVAEFKKIFDDLAKGQDITPKQRQDLEKYLKTRNIVEMKSSDDGVNGNDKED